MALLPEVGYGTVVLNQGNDDVGCIGTCSHVTSEAELIALAAVLAYNGEFGESMISMKKYESSPPVVTEFTVAQKAKTKGRLELQLVFENGKKEWIKIKEYYNDEAAITAMKTAIMAESAGAFGISSKVASINEKFIAA